MGKRKYLFLSICSLLLFIRFTAAVGRVQVRAVGPLGARVGFASLNLAFHDFTGVHMWLYEVTDILSVIPLGTVAAFAVIGAVQLLRRKKLRLVDADIKALGILFTATLGAFFAFEIMTVNYRPILIDGVLEASYPSSTTILVMCVMPPSTLCACRRIKCDALRRCINAVSSAITVLMIAARMFSGVHWLTDIIGGLLLAFGLVFMYLFYTDGK